MTHTHSTSNYTVVTFCAVYHTVVEWCHLHVDYPYQVTVYAIDQDLYIIAFLHTWMEPVPMSIAFASKREAMLCKLKFG